MRLAILIASVPETRERPVMNTIALIVAVVCALASFGLATWVWLALDDVGDEIRELAGVKGMYYQD